MDKSMIGAASGGALMDKNPAAARHLISNMVTNTQQFGIRGPSQSRMVNEIGATSNQRLENQLTELTSLLAAWKIAISAGTESRSLCSSTIWVHTKYILETCRLSTTDSAISCTTIPTTTTAVESAYSRKLSISKGPNEVACNQQPGVPTICELQQYAIPA
ncbi:hypothetical protein CR513_35504, partial [Mucuna pruriens]